MNNTPEYSDEENLKDENGFLKMKLMLEQGAQFGSMQTDSNLPVDIENQFLRNIIEFEKQYENQKTIKVFDKIERPGFFKPVNEIPDDDIENAFKNLDAYLQKYGIHLSVCSPDISCRELYRFTTEELFNHEMDDMYMPGMMTCFTYDEFYPDHKYENTRAAIDECIKPMLRKEPLEWMHHFRKKNIRLNHYFPITADEFKDIVNRFKLAYEDIELDEIPKPDCVIDDKKCVVNGHYNLIAKFSGNEINLQGRWHVEFELDEPLEYWYIINVQVEGINF